MCKTGKNSSFAEILCKHSQKFEVMSNSDFYVATSQIEHAGRGLFANRAFRRGENMLSYRYLNGRCGNLTESLTHEEFLLRYPDGCATHVLLCQGKYLDGKKDGTLAAKINTKPGSQNCRFNSAGNVIATKKINSGDELYASYGRSYNIRFDNRLQK